MNTTNPHPLERNSLICSACIDDEVLAAKIEALQGDGVCAVCNENRRTMSVDDLADLVKPVYERYVSRADDRMRIYEDSDNAHWVQGGETPNDILQELIGCEPEIADALLGALANANWHDVKDGGENYYDRYDEGFQLAPRESQAYSETMEQQLFDWEQFKWDIQHQDRFFNEKPAAYIAELFRPVMSGDLTGGTPPIIEAGPNATIQSIYRGREASSETDRRKIYANPAAELAAPPPTLRRAGRMNAAGIATFYGCTDETTCVAELRVPVGGTAIVGKFNVTRPIRLLDLRALEQSTHSKKISYFADDFIQQRVYVDFMRTLHDLLRRPVLPGGEAFEYLTTQFIAEYLSQHIDGILLNSSLVSRDDGNPLNQGLNVVLFSGASVAINDRSGAKYSIGRIFQADFTPDLFGGSEYVERAGLPEALPGVGISDHEPDATEPTLEILENDVHIVRVLGIRYDAPSRAVTFSDLQQGEEIAPY